MLLVILSSSFVSFTAFAEPTGTVSTNTSHTIEDLQWQMSPSAMNTTGPGIVWRSGVNNGFNFAIGPNGSSYVMSLEQTLPYVENGRLVSLTPEGRVSWSKSFEGLSIQWSTPSPDVNGNVRLLVQKDFGNVSLYNIDNNGVVLWKYDIVASKEHILFPSLSVYVDGNGTSFFTVNDDGTSGYDLVSYGGSLYAISSSGLLSWKHKFNDTDRFDGIVKGENGSSCLLADLNRLYSFNSDGKENWNFTFPWGFVGSGNWHYMSANRAGTIAVSSDYHLWIFNPNGTDMWNRSIPGSVSRLAIGDDDVTYAWISYMDTVTPAGLMSFDPKGTQLWKWVGASYTTSQIVIDGSGKVIFATGNTVHALDRNGNESWSYDAGETVQNIALDPNGRLLILTTSALLASNGIPKVTWLDWMVRNPVLIFVIVVFVPLALYAGAVMWRRRSRSGS